MTGLKISDGDEIGDENNVVTDRVSGSSIVTACLSLFLPLCIQRQRVAFCVAVIGAGYNVNPNQLQLILQTEFSLSQRPAVMPSIVP